MFGKRKDRSNMIKIGPFYYSKDFYELADNHVTGPALKRHFEFNKSMENYDFLMAMRTVSKRNAVALCQRYVKAGTPNSLNIAYATRQEVIKNVGNLFPHEGQRERMELRQMEHALAPRAGNAGAPPFVHKPSLSKDDVEDAFQPATTEVYQLVTADTIGTSSTGKFWQSEMFKSLHAWRKRRFWRKYMPNNQIPATRLSDEAFAKAVAADTNQATLEDLGMTQADLDAFLDFSDVPTTPVPSQPPANGNA
ncbi:MAG: hypothetical protein AAGD13_20085 [Pseudomonadota bacterium]